MQSMYFIVYDNGFYKDTVLIMASTASEAIDKIKLQESLEINVLSVEKFSKSVEEQIKREGIPYIR